MIKPILRILHFIGGDELLLKIMLVSGSAFFEYIAMWPEDGETVNVMCFAANKFHLDSFLSAYRSTDIDPQTN